MDVFYADSFGEDSAQDVMELPEEVITPPVIKSRGRKGRAKKFQAEEVIECSDVGTADDEISVETASPGVGQKGAFKKLTKIKSK